MTTYSEIVYDEDGNELGSFPISEKQMVALDSGSHFDVLYHTPQLLHSTLGTRSGSFTIHMEDDRVVTSTPAAFKQFQEIHMAVAAARKAN